MLASKGCPCLTSPPFPRTTAVRLPFQGYSGVRLRCSPHSPPSPPCTGASPGRPADPQPASNTSTSTAGTGGGSSSYRSSYQPPPYQAPPPRYGTGSGTYGSPRAQQQLFFLHAAMVLLGLFSVVPFLPYSRTAYVFLLRCTILASGYKLYLQFGLPSFRPLSSAMVGAAARVARRST